MAAIYSVNRTGAFERPARQTGRMPGFRRISRQRTPHPQGSPVIEFHQVHKTYRTGGRDVPALQPTQLEIASGERSEEHTSELQSLMRTTYAVICLKKK